MINKALEYANQLGNQEHRICAIITDKKGRILSLGFNSYSKTHPRMAYYAKKTSNHHKIYLHAELDAIISCKHKPYAIYIARSNKFGEGRNSSPCEICQLAIKDAGIKKVVHT